MSEFITVQVGQCGNQIGSALWPLILQEYGITRLPEIVTTQKKSNSPRNYQMNDTFHSFFSVGENKTLPTSPTYSDLIKCDVKARAVLIDMEDGVVNRYHKGPYRKLFDRECTVRNYPGSGNNWAEGYYTHGRYYRDKIEDVLRKTVEQCNSVHGFLMMFSVGGGTGSGLGSCTLEILEDLYPEIERFVTAVYPNGTEDVITCPYNAALVTDKLINHATCVFPVENRALVSIVNQQKAQAKNYVVDWKPFHDMNSIIVNMLLHLTCGSRFPGKLNVDMNDICTNLIPFPKLHFLTSSVCPISASVERQLITGQKLRNEIFVDCCHRKNQLIKIDPLGIKSTLLGAALIGRGDYTISDMRDYVERIQSRKRFTAWSREAIRVGLCGVPSHDRNASMLTLFNTTEMKELFNVLLEHFEKLYRKRAHVHHYTRVEGFDNEDFQACQESILSSINNYADISTRCADEPRYKVI